MHALPVVDPGTPDIRSAGRYLWWLIQEQRRTVLCGILAGIVWMGAPTLVPAAIGRAIDAGIAARDASALTAWAGVVFGLPRRRPAAVPAGPPAAALAGQAGSPAGGAPVVAGAAPAQVASR